MNQEKSESSYYLLLTLAFVSLFLHSAFFNDGTVFAQVLEKVPDLAISSIKPFLNPPSFQFSQNWIFDNILLGIITLIKNLGYLLGWYDTNQLNDDYLYDFAGIFRIVSFITGFISCILFFNLSKLLFKSELIAFFGTLLFMLHPIGSYFFYAVHPENMGMVFALIAIFYLVKFTIIQSHHYFYIGYLNLILALLTNLVFVFILVPVLFCFFITYCQSEKISYSNILLSKKFAKTLLYTFGIPIAIIILIHPHIILEFYSFYGSQQMIGGAQTFTNRSLPIGLFDYKNDPTINMNMAILIVIIFYLISMRKNNISILFLTNLLYCNIFIAIMIYGSNAHIPLNMFYTILPLLILNIMATIIFTLERLSTLAHSNSLKFSLVLLLGVYFSPVFLTNILAITSANDMLNRLTYNTTQYQSKLFIMGEIPVNSLIVHDPSISMPNMYKKSCSLWVCSINKETDFVILQQNSVHAEEQNFLNINHLIFKAIAHGENLSTEESYLDERYALGSQFKLIKKIQANVPIDYFFNSGFSGMRNLFSGANCLSAVEPEFVGTDILIYRNQATAMTKSEEKLRKTITHIAKMADLFYKLENWKDAEEQYLKHIDLSELVNDSAAVIVDKTILLDIYEKRNQLSKALDLVNQLLPITLLNLELDSLYTKLEHLYRKKVILNQQLNNQEESNRDSIKLADFYIACFFKDKPCLESLKKEILDLPERIEQAYLKKLELVNHDPSYSMQSITSDYMMLGRFYTSVKKWDKAINSYQEAIKLYTSLVDNHGLLSAYSALAATYGMSSSVSNANFENEEGELLTISGDIAVEESMHREINTRLQIVALCKEATTFCNTERLKNEYQNLLLLYQLLGDEQQVKKIEEDLNFVDNE